LNTQLLSEDYVVRSSEIDPLENELQHLVLRNNNCVSTLYLPETWPGDPFLITVPISS